MATTSLAGRECEACAKPSDRSRFCSDRCRCWARLHPGEQRPMGRRCANCRVGIDHLAAHAAFCSKRCVEIAHGNRRPAPVTNRKCGYCDAFFRPWRHDQVGCCAEHGNRIAWRIAGRRRRAAKKLGRPAGRFGADQLRLRLSMYAGCWICGGAPEQVDHVKPLNAGGLHILANLRPICAACNREKSDRWPFDVVR